jgi:tryptophanase
MKTIIEPYKIKSVEPIYCTTREQREKIPENAAYNTFFIHAGDILTDLLTDSRTSAMSSRQWAGVIEGTTTYGGL